MRYAVLNGGKRLRPILVLEACRAVGGDERDTMPAACAIELLHNYSLAHDDLPCMDNDDLRRGQPTCHKKYGEATALLVGDALFALAFRILSTTNGHAGAHWRRQLEAAHGIAGAVSHFGMVGGQAMDIEYRGKELDLPSVEYINTHKTGALIAVSVKTGALLGGGTRREVEALHHFGGILGFLFQVVDDVLDKDGYAKVVGVSEAMEEARELAKKAKREIAFLGSKAGRLSAIADFVVERKA